MESTDLPGLRLLCLIEDPADPGEWGSGFAVGPDLVLTCRHVIEPERPEWHVTPHEGARLTGRVLWKAEDPHLDAALIELDHPGPWAEDLFPPTFGELTDQAGQVGCVTYGYPILRKVAGVSEHESRPWTIMGTTGAEKGRYLISTPMALPRDREPDPDTGEYRSPWAGLSGAALLSEDQSVILGLIVSDPVRYVASTEAIRASALLRDSAFRRFLRAGEPVPWPPSEEEEETFADGIVRHSDELRGLAGMRANLTEDRLPFVAPAENSDAHPRRLLSLISDPNDDRGVVLVGAAGVGKTRTCLEVGTEAEKQGWTVLHLRTGEPAVTTEQLAAVIAATTDDVLIIVDYLHESILSSSSLHARVLPDARRAGRRVGLLASARTAWFERRSREDPYLSQLFRRVDLRPDDVQSRLIRDTVINKLAKKACGILGEDKVAALCGTRPVIAMLIAAELEASAERRTLTADGPIPRSGMLTGWLRRRLREDGLAVPPDEDDPLGLQPPPGYLQAITAMVAATPQDEQSLLDCAAGVLDNEEGARHLLGLVRGMGWLVDTPQGLATVHDIVTDHLLEQCLLRPDSGVVRSEVLDRLLGGSLRRGRSVARHATNLTRLIRELDVPGRPNELEQRYAGWVKSRAERIGTLLAEPTAEGATALIALITSAVLRSVVSSRWDELAGPWFERHDRTLPALRVLEQGLKSLDPGRRAWLARYTIRTLADRPPRLEEDHLLCVLLDADDLTGVPLGSVTSLAFRWLKLYGSRDNASFLLMSLLRRPGLDPDTLRAVGSRALSWLRTRDPAVASYVIRALLERDDMSEEFVSPTVELAYAHVVESPEALETSFLLAPIIAHPAVPADREDRLRELGFAWLELHGDKAEARFIINRLLRDPEAPADTVVRKAFDWLEEHGDGYYARPLIVSLIRRGGEVRRAALTQAFQWLTRHWERAEASYVLERLLGSQSRHGLDAVPYALRWLQKHGTQNVASYVLEELLARSDLPEQDASDAIAYADRWLEPPRRGAWEARFVLEKLLRRPELRGKVLARHAATAFHWLDEHSSDASASFVLRVLLQRQDLDRRAARQATAAAVTWWKLHPTVRHAPYVFLPLLEHPLLDPDQRTAVAERIPAWIDANEGAPLSAIFQLLKPEYAIPAEIRTALADRALVRFTSAKGLRRPLHHGSLDLALEVAFPWLTTHGSREDALGFLLALITRGDVVGEPLERVVTHVLGWLDGRPPKSSYSLLLCKFLPRHAELTDDHFDKAVEHALICLAAQPDHGPSGRIIVALLDDPRLIGPRLALVKDHARTWLGVHGDGPHAEAVREALARRGG
ncbi:S1 family peptidase [Actinoallomurus rhizosphaericola]|uniref:S1 family peptidase n=1 Tax=Actinoallomurus rhizosphaericola TaxID=2952536 RepID=UPI002092C8E9|nr:serine protease [Actinoallomurus rhizosphaericola]MCO5994960.1 serine protease [Actinoallomurus rhizosphaericola]